jgi:type VI secretion system secreted protein VgrG
MKDRFHFSCAALPSEILRVRSFSCEEALGRPYRLVVYADLNAEPGDLEVALGKPGSLSFAGTVFHGVLFEIELLLAVDARRLYRLTLAPELHALGLSQHSRVYIDTSVPELITNVLDRNHITGYELRLSGKYPQRRHICQYQESDLAFVHRWMEREGIYYYFLHQEDGSKLVICDDKDWHDDAQPATVRYYPSAPGDGLAEEAFSSWRRVYAGVTAGVSLGDYDYQKPMLQISASQARAARGSEEHVRFEDNLPDQAEAARLAAVRAERLRAAQVRFEGRGRALGLHPGLRVELEDHPRDGFNQRYQLSRVTHQGGDLHDEPEIERALGLPRAEEAYHVLVEALPADVQYRPERCTPWPEVRGVESAVVDGEAESPYAQIDAAGRYRVRLFFDEAESPDGAASAWLRMQQPHGGLPEGHHFPLRKGTEALVAFVHGDPDRPYIMGAAPTRRTPSTVTQHNHTQNVVQTGGLSRVEIEDQEGQQYVDISTPPEGTFVHLGAHAGLGDHNIVVSTKGDGLHHAGGNRDLTVGGVQTEDVTGNLKEEYAANQTIHVDGAFTETINSGETQTISSGSMQTIDGGLTQTISGGETRTVSGGLTETITGGRTQDITGATVETIGGSLNQTVTGAVSVSTPATYMLNASGGITMVTPASGTLKGLGGLKLMAPGGQMTVDSEYYRIGFEHNTDYFYRLVLTKFRMAFSASWFRMQGAHVGIFGLKIDIKGFNSKQFTSDKKYGGLSAKVAPTTTVQSGITKA